MISGSVACGSGVLVGGGLAVGVAVGGKVEVGVGAGWVGVAISPSKNPQLVRSTSRIKLAMLRFMAFTSI
jgi:hypothetical protein